MSTPAEIFVNAHEDIDIRFDQFLRDENRRHATRLLELDAARDREIAAIKRTYREQKATPHAV